MRARSTKECFNMLFCVFQDMANRILYVVVVVRCVGTCCCCRELWELWSGGIRRDWSAEGTRYQGLV